LRMSGYMERPAWSQASNCLLSRRPCRAYRHRIRRCYQQRHRRADKSCASDSTTGCLRCSTRCPCTTSWFGLPH